MTPSQGWNRLLMGLFGLKLCSNDRLNQALACRANLTLWPAETDPFNSQCTTWKWVGSVFIKKPTSKLRLRAASLFSWSVEQNARDTQMTTCACTALTKSEKKRDYSQSKQALWPSEISDTDQNLEKNKTRISRTKSGKKPFQSTSALIGLVDFSFTWETCQ